MPEIVAAVARAVPAVGALISGVNTAGQLFSDAVNLITGGDDARTIAERQQRLIDAQNSYNSQLAAAIAASNPDMPPAQVAAAAAASQAASSSGGGGGVQDDLDDGLYER